jgi:hypothetical protein
MRPLVITFLALLLLLLGLAAAWAAGWSLLAPSPEPFLRQPWLYGLMAVQSLITGVGLWRIRRWAFLAYGLLWLLTAGITLIAGLGFDPRSLAGPIIMALVGWRYWQRLGANNSFKPKPLRGSA